MNRYVVVCLVLIAVSACSHAHAAQIYLDPATGKYPPGVTFAVDVRLDNQNQCVNATEVDLSYPKNTLQAVAVADGDSILSLWIKEPTIYADYGLISFIGGLPGGYCGRTAGDPTLSNKLATIYFRFPTSTAAAPQVPDIEKLIFLSSTKAILNDGAGTLAALTTGGAAYSKIIGGQYAPLDTWQNAIANDTTPPEVFTVGVYRDSSLFDNKWFAVFSTVDKQTGIDHYEVAEVPLGAATVPQNQWKWIRAVSPYLIKDQALNSMIVVRAIDAAGNTQIEHYLPAQTPQQKSPIIGFSYLAIISVVAAFLIRFIISLF